MEALGTLQRPALARYNHMVSRVLLRQPGAQGHDVDQSWVIPAVDQLNRGFLESEARMTMLMGPDWMERKRLAAAGAEGERLRIPHMRGYERTLGLRDPMREFRMGTQKLLVLPICDVNRLAYLGECRARGPEQTRRADAQRLPFAMSPFVGGIPRMSEGTALSHRDFGIAVIVALGVHKRPGVLYEVGERCAAGAAQAMERRAQGQVHEAHQTRGQGQLMEEHLEPTCLSALGNKYARHNRVCHALASAVKAAGHLASSRVQVNGALQLKPEQRNVRQQRKRDNPGDVHAAHYLGVDIVAYFDVTVVSVNAKDKTKQSAKQVMASAEEAKRRKYEGSLGVHNDQGAQSTPIVFVPLAVEAGGGVGPSMMAHFKAVAAAGIGVADRCSTMASISQADYSGLAAMQFINLLGRRISTVLHEYSARAILSHLRARLEYNRIYDMSNMDDIDKIDDIDNFILNFRKYFEADSRNPLYFHSVRGIGYKFTD